MATVLAGWGFDDCCSRRSYAYPTMASISSAVKARSSVSAGRYPASRVPLFGALSSLWCRLRLREVGGCAWCGMWGRGGVLGGTPSGVMGGVPACDDDVSSLLHWRQTRIERSTCGTGGKTRVQRRQAVRRHCMQRADVMVSQRWHVICVLSASRVPSSSSPAQHEWPSKPAAPAVSGGSDGPGEGFPKKSAAPRLLVK